MVCEARGDDEQMRGPSGFAQDVAPMTRARAKLLCGLLMMLVFGVESARARNSIGPQGLEHEVIRRQTWLIPAQDRSTVMWTTFNPDRGDRHQSPI
jgi:hypothetical protein